jgi:hypothetical protein
VLLIRCKPPPLSVASASSGQKHLRCNHGENRINAGRAKLSTRC